MRFIIISTIVVIMMGTMGLLVADTPPQGHANVTGSTVASTQGGKEYLELTVHLTGLSGQAWKDLHLDLPWPYQFPKKSSSKATVTAPDGSTQDWSTSDSAVAHEGRRNRPRGGLNIYTGSNANNTGFTAQGDYKIKFEVPAGTGNLPTPDATWTTTNDGNSSINNDGKDVMDGGSAYKVYGGSVVANNGLDLPAPIGIATMLACQANPEQAGSSYKIFTSRSLSLGFTDPLGIGIYSESDPIPEEWDVLILNAVGAIAPSGGTDPVPTVKPRAPIGSGHTFYLVCAIVDGEEVLFSSEPIEITIP